MPDWIDKILREYGYVDYMLQNHLGAACKIEYEKEYIENSIGFEGDWLYESWLWRYIRENAEKYGVKVLKYIGGRAGGGGDFLVEYLGKVMKCEVEWFYSGYFMHIGDKKYLDVELLICTDAEKPNEKSEQYPKYQVYIPAEDFAEWYHKVTGRHSKPKKGFWKISVKRVS